MEKEAIDWKKNMLLFMKVIGEESGDWHPEMWATYGITKEDAQVIIGEYEKAYPDDL